MNKNKLLKVGGIKFVDRGKGVTIAKVNLQTQRPKRKFKKVNYSHITIVGKAKRQKRRMENGGVSKFNKLATMKKRLTQGS